MDKRKGAGEETEEEDEEKVVLNFVDTPPPSPNHKEHKMIETVIQLNNDQKFIANRKKELDLQNDPSCLSKFIVCLLFIWYFIFQLASLVENWIGIIVGIASYRVMDGYNYDPDSSMLYAFAVGGATHFFVTGFSYCTFRAGPFMDSQSRRWVRDYMHPCSGCFFVVIVVLFTACVCVASSISSYCPKNGKCDLLHVFVPTNSPTTVNGTAD